uniref:Zinc finger C3HC-type containing 1 n=1 Tax=Cebus imitator TaxID=2715852 RepID=A0A2K5PP20_CEBIM
MRGLPWKREAWTQPHPLEALYESLRDTSATSQSVNGSPQVEQSSLESTSKEAFFSRVETFSISFFSSCELPFIGFWIYRVFFKVLLFMWISDKQRCAELKKALCTAHEKFCFWPDSPSPEDKISLLLHLLEDELDHRTDERKTTTKLGSDIQVHVTACILSVCGWACSSSLEPMQLSLITCSQCMRKVGLWGFQQIESSITDLDTSFGLTSSPIPGLEGRPERFPLVPESPRRMMTRSQDATFSPGSEQAEKSPGPIVSRTRSWDSSSPVDRPEPEAASPTTRTRPVTRSMGTGDTPGLEVPSSPLRKAKRARLCSSSSSDTSSRSFFDPTSQHRDWCPWVNITLGKESRENGGTEPDASDPAEPGWKAVLTILLAHKQSSQPAETDSVSLCEKSRKVFRIFRQWESLCSS